MAVFEYPDDAGPVGRATNPERDMSMIVSQMQMVDDDVEDVSVVNQGKGDYITLRATIPGKIAKALDIDEQNTLLMKPVSDEGLLIRVV